MKVIHFLNELKYSGAEIMYVDAAPVFQRLGCELTVVNTAKQMGEYAPFFERAGYTLKHLPIQSSFVGRWNMRNQIIELIKGYDVVHIHRHDLHWILSYCAWKAGCKAVYTAHNVFRSHWYSYLLHFMQHWMAEHWFHCKLQTISDSVDTNEREYFHAKTHLVYNWYGSNRFFPAHDGEKDNLRAGYNIPQNALVIISVGGCSPIKRHTDIIKALPEIIEHYPNVIYLHLGMGYFLKEEEILVKKLNLASHVRFLGNQSDVRKYLVMSDIYAMPSRFEGIPITTIEAMATGIPCVLYDVPGLKDFNKEGVISMTIPEDYHLLAESICRLYADKELQKKNVTGAMNLVHRKFFMETNARKIVELYMM